MNVLITPYIRHDGGQSYTPCANVVAFGGEISNLKIILNISLDPRGENLISSNSGKDVYLEPTEDTESNQMNVYHAEGQAIGVESTIKLFPVAFHDGNVVVGEPCIIETAT